MSHSTVLVIGDDVKRQLASFHEFECTGRKDEYVVEVDVTNEVIEYFNTPVNVVRLADGSHVNRYSDSLYTGKPEHKHGHKTFELPHGAEDLKELPAEEARGYGVGALTLDEAARSHYGDEVIVRDGQYFKLTNPNAKWDWWCVGGRWTGSLKLKPARLGIVGKPGMMTERCPPGYADSARKGDVDYEQMRNDAEVKARALWNDTRRITGGLSWDSWDDTLTRYCGAEDEDGKRPKGDQRKTAQAEYHEQPAVELLKVSKLQAYQWEIDDNLALDCEIYVKRQRDRVAVNFAFIQDQTWTEKGSMGWWGMSRGDVSQAQWNTQFSKMLDKLPDDALLTVVDCHI